MAQLSDPLALPSGLRLPNRIAKAAMTENLADADNQPTQELARLYARWAQGGSGLLVTGNLMVDRRFLERSRNVVADDHLDVSALRSIGEAVRAACAETAVLAQINHPGRQTNRFLAWEPVAPSAVDAVSMMGLFGKPRALRAEEVEEIVAGFGRATRLCAEAGLDGVQVHAAHGYLLAQFLSPRVNKRSDRWGGAVAERARALLECVRAARASSADGGTVAVKLNSSDFRHGGFTEDDAEEVVRLLVEEGIDLIEVSGGTYEDPALFGLSEDQRDGRSEKEAYFAGFAQRARSAAPDTPIMLTGGIRTRSVMEELLASDDVDVIGLARPLAIDPDLATKLLQGHQGTELPSYNLPTVAGMAGESEWYEAQIGRLGNGKEPDEQLSALKAASGFVTGEMVRGLSGRRRRQKLVEQLDRS